VNGANLADLRRVFHTASYLNIGGGSFPTNTFLIPGRTNS
jgi:hypothetical protein